MKSTIIKSTQFRLFLISFIILFFELVCIRWLSAYVLYLGFFTNFVLLGCFLGIGTGTLQANKQVQLIKYLPILLFLFFPIFIISRAQVTPEFEGLIYFTTSTAALRLPAYVILTLIFISITAIFAFLSQDLGILLNEFPPLKAYQLNILGSLLGIAVFTAVGFLQTPSWVWFLVVAVTLILLLPSDRSLGRNIILLAGMVAVIAISDVAYSNIWSPYSRLNLLDDQENQLVRISAPADRVTSKSTFTLFSNGILHQAFVPISPGESNYALPYTSFP